MSSASRPRMTRRRALLLTLIAATGVIAAATTRLEPALIYNPSNSVPSGFYVRTHDPLRPGAIVTVHAAAVAPDYAAARDYADRTDRFLKRIAATAGQVVCAEGASISIDGVDVAERIEFDSTGRALPSWDGGCRTLTTGEVLLLGDTADSFDGRYWGPISADLIQGVWRQTLD
jgi:conjugative transfer signal peptidase TraF